MINDKNIDVFIPVYNDERYIARAIKSCLDQVDVNVRVLVSDNCSTDATGAIIREMANNDPRVIIHRNKTNTGMIKNMHRLQELVERPFYMFLCSDDYLLDNSAFASALALFEKYPDLTSIYSNIDFIDPNGKLIATNNFNRGEVFDADQAMQKSLITTRNCFGIPLMHRTEFGKQYRYLEEALYAADLWHSFKVGKNGRCGHVNRSCIGNTYTGDNLTRSLMSGALKELKFLANLEGIQLTKLEKIRQSFNHVKTFCSKYIFFKMLVPFKTYMNKIAS